MTAITQGGQAVQRRLVMQILRGVAPMVALASLAAPASATESSDVFSATVYLPDGSTPAPAAAVDFALAEPGAAPFARGVADNSGNVVVDVPESTELVALALANGGRLGVRWTASKLYWPQGARPAPDAGQPATMPQIPSFSQATGEFVASLVDSATGSTATPFSDLDGVAFVVPTPAVSDSKIITRVAEIVNAAGIYNDPDLVSGNEDVDDPDVVPPIGAVVDVIAPVLDAAGVQTTASAARHELSGGFVSAGPKTIPGVTQTGGHLLQPEEGDRPNCGQDPGTQWVSKEAGNNPEGTKTYVYLDTYSCDSDRDPDRDEVGYRWEGYTGGASQNWHIWRFKFRTQANSETTYRRKRPWPPGNIETGNPRTVEWFIGFEKVVSAGFGGTYHFPAKKIHPWFYDDHGKLYHVSWISNSKRGSYSADAGFGNGGGFLFDVPEGDNGRRGAQNSVIIWRCYWADPAEGGGYANSWCDGGR